MWQTTQRSGVSVQRGMALLAVLWIVAALSIIATGITRTIRLESRVTVQARQEVEAQALGDGAIQIALQTLMASNQPLTRMVLADVSYRGVVMQVQIMPLSGLIDINMAGLPLLERLFAVAGGLPPDAAQAAAQAVMQARERRDSKGAAQRFEAEEDLLRVSGIDYDLYATLSGLITADLRGQGKVNPMAAPPEVLSVLAGGNTGVAARIAADREAGRDGIDTTALEAEFIDSAVVRRFQITARVPVAAGIASRAACWRFRRGPRRRRSHPGRDRERRCNARRCLPSRG